jgi:hypothetical protein
MEHQRQFFCQQTQSQEHSKQIYACYFKQGYVWIVIISYLTSQNLDLRLASLPKS